MKEALTELAVDIFKDNSKKGFHEVSKEKGTLLMLIVSELGEALEADRKKYYSRPINPKVLNTILEELTSGDGVLTKRGIESFEAYIKDTEEDEIADAIIRLFDYAGKYNIDIGTHIMLKLAYNRTRPYKHGKEY